MEKGHSDDQRAGKLPAEEKLRQLSLEKRRLWGYLITLF